MITLQLDQSEFKALKHLLECVCILHDYAFLDVVDGSEISREGEKLKKTFEKVRRKMEKMSEMVKVVVSEPCQTGDCDCMQYYKMTVHRQCTELLPPYHKGCTCYAVTQTGERLETTQDTPKITPRPLIAEENTYNNSLR